MPNPKELERIGRLFKATSGLNKSFLDKCSDTKFLAVKDYYKAEDEYIKLAAKTLSVKGLGIAGKDDCYSCLSNVTSALESGQLDIGLIDALENLRKVYLDNLLRPAFRQYINNETANNQALKKLYSNALKIENLIEVFQFMSKIQHLD